MRANEIIEESDITQTMVVRDHIEPLGNGYDLHLADTTVNGRMRQQHLAVVRHTDTQASSSRKALLSVNLRQLFAGNFEGQRYAGCPSVDELCSGIDVDDPMHTLLVLSHLAGDLKGREVAGDSAPLGIISEYVGALMTAATVSSAERLERRIDDEQRVRLIRSEHVVGTFALRRCGFEIIHPEIGIGITKGSVTTQVERNRYALESFQRPSDDADYRALYANPSRNVSKSGLSEAHFDPFVVDLLQEAEQTFRMRYLRADFVAMVEHGLDKLERLIENERTQSPSPSSIYRT